MTSSTHARDIPIPVPPLLEQHEIVRRVDALFVVTDQIEARTYEPASALLERIKSQPLTNSHAKPKPRRTKKR